MIMEAIINFKLANLRLNVFSLETANLFIAISANSEVVLCVPCFLLIRFLHFSVCHKC